MALYVVDLVAGNVTTATGTSTKAKPATIDTRLAAIGAAHRAAGYESPARAEAVRMVRRGIRRTVGTAQRQVRPVSVRELQMMMEGLSADSSADCRDRALLLIGFAGALRRSELAALDASDLVESSNGLTATIRRSKTDQEGAGRTIGIPYGRKRLTCPVRAWRAWLTIAGISEGPAFARLPAPVGSALPVLAGSPSPASSRDMPPPQASTPAGGCPFAPGRARHLGRRGRRPERVIANTTGHKGTTMLRKYIREGSLFRENAAAASDCDRGTHGKVGRAGRGYLFAGLKRLTDCVPPCPAPRALRCGLCPSAGSVGLSIRQRHSGRRGHGSDRPGQIARSLPSLAGDPVRSGGLSLCLCL